MRQSKREITDRLEILEILNRCQVCRLALNDDDGFPYLLPVNYGFEDKDGQIRFYFHSALEGRKIELLQRDNRASFEVDGKHQLQYDKERGYCTYAYESVIGKGHITFITDEKEKFDALTKLMEHYHPGVEAPFNPAAMPRTHVYQLTVESMTAKRKDPKPGM